MTTKKSSKAVIPTVTIALDGIYAVAVFDYDGYPEPYHIKVVQLDEPMDDDGRLLTYRLEDDSGADVEYFKTFHEAVQALHRAVADQMALDSDDDEGEDE